MAAPQLAYNKGVVLIRCPGCQALHLMADRLGWFANVEAGEKTIDIVDMMKRKGEAVRAVSALNASLAPGDDDAAANASDQPPSAAEAGAGGGVVGGGDAADGSAEGPTPLDLELMEGVMELTEEDIRVLQAEGKFVLGQPPVDAATGEDSGEGATGTHEGSDGHEGGGDQSRA